MGTNIMFKIRRHNVNYYFFQMMYECAAMFIWLSKNKQTNKPVKIDRKKKKEEETHATISFISNQCSAILCLLTVRGTYVFTDFTALRLSYRVHFGVSCFG